MTIPPARTSRLAADVDALFDDATDREPFVTDDSKSGSRFERLVLDGRPHVVKHLSLDDDWIMRASGDWTCRPVQVAAAGILDALPAQIDAAVVAAAWEGGTPGPAGALLMPDVGAQLVPEGSAPLALATHLAFLDHMAALHDIFWGWSDDVGLLPLSSRYLELSPCVADTEAERGTGAFVPGLIGDGWRLLPSVAPEMAAVLLPLLDDPSPFLDALDGGPRTLVHGDWKLGNLGTAPDGRTILLDWAMPGSAPPLADLAWYLAINTARLPHSKEDALAAYRSALEARGRRTEGWWDREVDLALLGAAMCFGWEKALGGPGDELSWWSSRVVAGAAHLPR